MFILLFSFIYKHITKKIFFLFDPEKVHVFVTTQGEFIGRFETPNKILSKAFARKSPILKQKIAGIEFNGPIGLAAGFDYEGRLTQVLPSIGFGFDTVGTITNSPYSGNPKPMLGRLPKSKSLMVNKGFKNMGAERTVLKLEKQKITIPLGISIGKTNTTRQETQKTAIEDIIKAFKIFEQSKVKISYYELNISCPNLFGNITFYPPKNLHELLIAVDGLSVKKPLFVKMPIEKTDIETEKMLEVITHHKVAGVIFGNLQKDRKDPALNQQEVAKFKKGYFSGLPTQKRSDELIALAYKKYRGKLIIIGCGGVFSARDAYKKIKLGANLVQLITGLIYEGPLLVAKINNELPKLLKQDGFKNITEAVGAGI